MRKKRKMRKRLSIGLISVVFISFITSYVYATPVHCPPEEGEIILDEKNVAGDNTKMDKLVERQSDEKGNIVELWCIDDTWFGKRYVPKDGNPVWVGKCWYKGGRNWQDKCSPDNTGERGKPDEWQKLSWTNAEPPPNGKYNWEYTYWAVGPDKGKLKVEKTEGKWSDPYHVPNCEWWRKYTVETTEEYSFEDAPADFDQIPGYDQNLQPIQNSLPGVAAQLFNFNPVQEGPLLWEYAISLPSVGGSGTEEDPYCGLPVEIRYGDTITLSAAGVTSPDVTGLAELYGWEVGSYDSSFVSYQYKGITMTLDPGYVIQGFCFQSPYGAGQQGWTCYGDGLNYADTTTGPIVPEPSTILLLSFGFLGLIGIGGMRKRVWKG